MNELMPQVIGWGLSIFLIASAVLLLWAIVRFSIVSEWRTRGWRQRLRQPEVAKVAAHWQVQIPAAIEHFYREAPFIELQEFTLSSPTSPEKTWFIDGFNPFTVVDLAEAIKITGVPGLPLARGGEDGKGTYYLPLEALRQELPNPVLLGLAGAIDVEVAATIDEFARFDVVENEE